MVVYERRLGRLTANSFSYSGNTQGCEHAIRHLHTLLDNVQAKISGQPAAGSPPAGSPTAPVPLGATQPTSAAGVDAAPYGANPRTSGQPPPPLVNPAASAPTGSVIPLTPGYPSR